MLRVMARRLLTAVPLVVLVTFLVFLLVTVAPGDPVDTLAGENPTPELIASIREELRLDDPLLVRYGAWLTSAVQGDLGESYVTDRPVTTLILDRLPITLSLAVVSLALMLVVGTIAGVVGAMWPRGILGRMVTVVSSIAIAIPPFWLGLVLVMLLSVRNSIFPSLGYTPFAEGPWDWAMHLVLPAIALGAFGTAELALQLKGSLAETLRREYIMAARAKGMASRSLIFKHGMKNAAIPVVTVLGFRVAQLLGGSVIVESVFAIPGLGTLALNATQSRDVPVMIGLVTMTTLFVVLINVAVDVSYTYFNPRSRT